ncbi:AtpZ/AtpI family protein [Bryobacter aggregatus]|uniref:AtpZ/AtpI family protein n=1 Tax=Bryobacter aggregatus TaxID=360054 RepID=UPI0004E26BB3|nr:AtpZ/AtpI family protein [Bryobacter aggregatus]
MGKAAAYMSLPFLLLAAIGGGYYAGEWLDQHFGTKYWNVAGLILGFGLGLYELMRQLKILERRNRD